MLDEAKKRARAMRFEGGVSSAGFAPMEEAAPSTDKIVGTCQVVAKQYLRLTVAANPANVRPAPVLRKALKMVLRQWADGKSYEWCASQLKSIRQDITVQHLEQSDGELSIDVYETHARLAIHQG